MLPKYTVLTNVYYINISKHYQTSLQFWLMTMYSCLSRYYNYLSTGKVSYSLSYFLDWQSTFWNMFEVFVRMGDSYTNPSETKQIEPFWLFFFTKRIHETNLLNTIEQNESTKRIFWTPKDETNPRNESFEHCRTNESTKRIFWTP
jgi:hypothetical protein